MDSVKDHTAAQPCAAATAWVLVGTQAALRALAPLIDAHRAVRPVRLWPVSQQMAQDPSHALLRAAAQDAAAILLVGSRQRTPRRMLPGLFVFPRVQPISDASPIPRQGARMSPQAVPIGWVPDVGAAGLARFAHAAAVLQARAAAQLARGPIALLGQWEDRTLRMAGRTEVLLRAPVGTGAAGDASTLPGGADGTARRAQPMQILRWTADRIVRRDLLVALRMGLGVALYLGHGRPIGWAGYHGLHTRHLRHARGEPQGTVLTLACDVGRRPQSGLGFAETLMVEGIAASALGAVDRTLHIDNSHFVIDLCHALRAGAQTLADLVLAARRPGQPDRARCERRYRIFGDPLAPLLGSLDAHECASQVFAPGPDELLPPSPDAQGHAPT